MKLKPYPERISVQMNWLEQKQSLGQHDLVHGCRLNVFCCFSPSSSVVSSYYSSTLPSSNRRTFNGANAQRNGTSSSPWIGQGSPITNTQPTNSTCTLRRNITILKQMCFIRFGPLDGYYEIFLGFWKSCNLTEIV